MDIQNLTVSFEATDPVIQNVSFSILRGQTVALVGESGSGKTLTSLAIMNLLPKNAKVHRGRIDFGNTLESYVNLLSLREKDLQMIRGNQIGMIFQEPMTSLNPSMKCGKQVTEVLLKHNKVSEKDAREKVLEQFAEVQLPRVKQIFDSYPHQLSGGQRQRVMIAMAMICNPRLLIADEPTTALDVTVQKTILTLLKQLQEKYGMSLLFVTHNLGIVSEIADEVVVMHQGKVVEIGNLNQILKNPVEPYTRGLIACQPPLNEKPYRLKTIEEFIHPTGEGENIRQPVIKNPGTEKAVLEVKNLSTGFVTKRTLWGKPKNILKAVDEVNFEVYKGETLGIVGESGCGKTTLGRTILKLVKAQSGQIIYNGTNITNLTENQFRKFRKNLQIIFQNPFSSLNPKLTIGEALSEPMAFHGIMKNNLQRKERIIEILKKVNLLPEHFNRYPHEFSGGQRQRIGIARALCVEPEIIICDESVSSLDVSVQAQVLNLLNDLKVEFGLTYIFISHDLAVVKYMSDRIIVMNEGRIEEKGEAEKIFASPVSDITKTLINAIPGLKNRN